MPWRGSKNIQTRLLQGKTLILVCLDVMELIFFSTRSV